MFVYILYSLKMGSDHPLPLPPHLCPDQYDDEARVSMGSDHPLPLPPISETTEACDWVIGTYISD